MKVYNMIFYLIKPKIINNKHVTKENLIPSFLLMKINCK